MLFSSFRKHIREYQIKHRLRQKDFAVEEVILLFGEPRSGSTWLMELLQTIPATAVSWEPFSDPNDALGVAQRWGCQINLQQGVVQEAQLKDLIDALTLKHYTVWTTRALEPKQLLKSKFLITKMVRATHLLPYILHQIPLLNPPIWLLRHPVDVALSQLSVSIPTQYNPQYYAEHKELLESMPQPLERQVAIWCLNNLLPSTFKPDDSEVQLVCYEELITKPEEVFSSILDRLQIGFPKEEVLSQVDFHKSSQTDFYQDLRTEVTEQLYKNIDLLSTDQRRNIQQIFDYFGLKLYEASSPYPISKQLPIMHRAAQAAQPNT